MDEIKISVAKNIAEYRKKHNLTQLQLAEKLNYSDKAVSKWERAEAVPDIYILRELAKLFGITVDELIGSSKPKKKKESRPGLTLSTRNRVIIVLLSVGLVWLVATLVFSILNWASLRWDNWLMFIYAIPVSTIVGIVFNMMWGKRITNTALVSVLIWTVALSIFLTFRAYDITLWLIFIIGIPLQVLTILWLFLKRK